MCLCTSYITNNVRFFCVLISILFICRDYIVKSFFGNSCYRTHKTAPIIKTKDDQISQIYAGLRLNISYFYISYKWKRKGASFLKNTKYQISRKSIKLESCFSMQTYERAGVWTEGRTWRGYCYFSQLFCDRACKSPSTSNHFSGQPYASFLPRIVAV